MVSPSERRQADLFFAELLGGSATPFREPRGRRSWRPGEAVDGDAATFDEEAPVSLEMRGGGVVGNTAAAVNVREDVLHALDRLHVLWSITDTSYGIEYPRVAALAAGSRVPNPDVNLARLVAAIRQNDGAHLHHKVMRHFFGIDVGAPVGTGQPNRTADVRKLQTILVALGRLADTAIAEGIDTGGSIRESTLPRTLAAIRDVKARIAGGRIGWDPIHADELESGGDRFGTRTFCWSNVSIFVPRGASEDAADVHVCFTPGDEVQSSSGLNAALHHGLRAACEGTGWILIAVPGQEPGYVTIDTAKIEGALRRAGRNPAINRLRLSAHSRGGRGLRETIAGRLVDIAKIDRVVLLDCGWRSIADALTRARIPASKVLAYQVIDTALPATAGRTMRIDPGCARAIGYSRLIQDAMDTRPSLAIPADVRRQLLPLPRRGRFKAATATAGSSDSLDAFCRANASAIAAIVRDEAATPNGLKTFVDANDLGRLGGAYRAGIYSHHFFVAEIAHEITG